MLNYFQIVYSNKSVPLKLFPARHLAIYMHLLCLINFFIKQKELQLLKRLAMKNCGLIKTRKLSYKKK